MIVLSHIKTFPVLGNFSEGIVTEESCGITVANEVLLNTLALIVMFCSEGEMVETGETSKLSSEEFPQPCNIKNGMDRTAAAKAELKVFVIKKFFFMVIIIA